MGFYRTTLMLDEAIYRRIKRMAVDRNQPIRAVVQEALRLFCEGRLPSSRKAGMPRFGRYRFRLKEGLRRADIYAERV